MSLEPGPSNSLPVVDAEEAKKPRMRSAWKRRTTGGVLAFVGYMLSPLSWWNDAFVNVPLALAFAWIIGLFYRPAFEASWIVGYWLTNVLGFVLMHKGAEKIVRKEDRKYSWRSALRDIVVSLLYTGLIVLLILLVRYWSVLR